MNRPTKVVFKDKFGNKIMYGKNSIGVMNAEGKFLNAHATKKFLKEQGYQPNKVKGIDYAYKLKGGKLKI